VRTTESEEGGRHLFSLIFGHEIHLVHKTKDLGSGRVLLDGIEAGVVVLHVLLLIKVEM
jgi:hypothetical protein